MIFTGKLLTGSEAAEIGLVNDVDQNPYEKSLHIAKNIIKKVVLDYGIIFSTLFKKKFSKTFKKFQKNFFKTIKTAQ